MRRALGRNPIAALIGPRQCGKTTLAEHVSRAQHGLFFDLESPRDLARLEQPLLELEEAKGLVVIDEVQRLPELFPVLRVLADRKPLPCRFLLLGSASPDFVRGSSESLAGRIEFVEMGGFDMREVGASNLTKLWVRGGFPRSFLARNGADSVAWRQNFIGTFLERDMPQLGVQIPATTLRRFWTMLAHCHGRTLNYSMLAASLGVSDKTVRHYLEILSGTFMVRLLPPWFENVKKRQVKAPKVYLTDSGVLHALLELPTRDALLAHPIVGHSWEGFALEHLLRYSGTRQAYFWRVHSGPELDLLILQNGKRIGFEFKRADAPTMTSSMQSAIEMLNLAHLWVVYPGKTRYKIHEHATVLPLEELGESLPSRPGRRPTPRGSR